MRATGQALVELSKEPVFVQPESVRGDLSQHGDF